MPCFSPPAFGGPEAGEFPSIAFPLFRLPAGHLLPPRPLFHALCDPEGSQEGPTDDPDGYNTEKCTDTVDHNVLLGRTAPVDEGLVVFVSGGKADAEQTGDQHQRESPQSIYIKRE